MIDFSAFTNLILAHPFLFILIVILFLIGNIRGIYVVFNKWNQKK
jgi:hypothetical protein